MQADKTIDYFYYPKNLLPAPAQAVLSTKD